MKKIYLCILACFLLYIGCKEDETTDIEVINTDISVTSSESLIFWLDQDDLTQQINEVFTFNHGNALENEIRKTITYNTDTTEVTANIEFKQAFQEKYHDGNITNNTATIELQKNTINTGYIPISSDAFMSTPSQEVPLASTNNLPASYDFSHLMPPVGNQGSQGSCVAWSTGYYLKSYHEKIENGYGYNDNSKLMSPAYIYNQIKESTCLNGSYFPNAFELLKDKGVCSLQEMPYNQNDCNTQPSFSQNQSASANKILNYYRIDINNSSVANIKYYLSNDIPVIIGVKIDDVFQSKVNINYEYIYNGVTNSSNTGYHAMTVVGYDNSKNAFKVINSWGDNWGNNGYCWIHYDLFSDGTLFSNSTVFRAYWTEDATNVTNTSNIQLSGDIDFGNVEVGQSETRQLTIENTGNESFNITDITTSNSAFNIAGSSTVVQPNSDITVQIQFTPTLEQSYSGIITVDSTADNANSSNSTIQVIGVGFTNTSNSSNISVTGNLNFGNVTIGESDTRTFYINNTGNQSFNVSNINFPSSAYTANFNSGTITPGNPQAVIVTFQPTNVQSYSGTVTVNHNADGGTNTINISGNGINNNTGQPNLIYNDYNITSDDNFNDIVEAGEDIDFDIELQNIGNTTATNIEVIINTDDPDIFISDIDRDYDDMPAGDFEWNGGSFDFQVTSTCPTKTVIFTMQINSDQGSWTDSFSIDVQGQNSDLPQEYAVNSPRDNCSATGASDSYRLGLNINYYRDNWNIDNIIGYGSDGKRGMWYRFRTTTAGNYIISLTMNGDTGFELYTVCGNSPVAIKDDSNGNSETQSYTINSANTDIYIRFYDNDDNSNVDFDISIEH